MILEVFSKPTLNVVNKSLRIFKKILKEDFRVKPRNKSCALITVFKLNSFDANSTTEK